MSNGPKRVKAPSPKTTVMGVIKSMFGGGGKQAGASLGNSLINMHQKPKTSGTATKRMKPGRK